MRGLTTHPAGPPPARALGVEEREGAWAGWGAQREKADLGATHGSLIPLGHREWWMSTHSLTAAHPRPFPGHAL